MTENLIHREKEKKQVELAIKAQLEELEKKKNK